MNTSTKICPACGKTVKGRMDKKFCDDYCRNQHNNQLNSNAVNYVRNVNNILRRNRRILEESMAGIEKATTKPKAELMKRGYDFNFFTSIFVNQGKETYYFCYEYGFKEIDPERCMIVRNTTQKHPESMDKRR